MCLYEVYHVLPKQLQVDIPTENSLQMEILNFLSFLPNSWIFGPVAGCAVSHNEWRRGHNITCHRPTESDAFTPRVLDRANPWSHTCPTGSWSVRTSPSPCPSPSHHRMFPPANIPSAPSWQSPNTPTTHVTPQCHLCSWRVPPPWASYTCPPARYYYTAHWSRRTTWPSRW